MKTKYRSKIAKAMHEAAVGLQKSGIVDEATMREFDESCLVPAFEPKQLIAFRERERLSQAALAERLEVSVATVSQWERGARTPQGPARKLLRLALTKGLAYIQ